MIVDEGQNIEYAVPPDQRSETIEVRKNAHVRVRIDGKRILSLSAVLSGEDALLEIAGVFAGTKQDEQNILLNVVQDAPRTSCTVRFRSVLDHASISRVDGLIRMTERAIDAHAKFSYRGMLLSPQGRCLPTPRLEVLTKQVASASHEAAVGVIDAVQMFYLQSRGISAQEAKLLITKGFLDTV